ncbi:MAG: hypothetical protein KGL39_44810, partial [Patescibacteria group bacterium]|nr:hypothetical protein [Patescibacteria group bacterium]
MDSSDQALIDGVLGANPKPRPKPPKPKPKPPAPPRPGALAGILHAFAPTVSTAPVAGGPLAQMGTAARNAAKGALQAGNPLEWTLGGLMHVVDAATHGGGSAVAGKVMNVLDAPFTLAGAGVQDVEAHRQNPLMSLYSLGHPGNTAINHALALMNQGRFGDAARRFSLVNLAATKARAQHGEPLARWLTQHPTLFGLGAGAAEFANPANIALGEATGLAGRGVRAGLGAAARGAESVGARSVARAARTAAEGPLNRFADVQQAARR